MNMTMGQLMLYGGAALLALTLVLALIFALRKPKYQPASAAYIVEPDDTRSLSNGTPTGHTAARRESGPAPSAETELQLEGTGGSETELLPDTEMVPDGATVIEQPSGSPSAETELIQHPS